MSASLISYKCLGLDIVLVKQAADFSKYNAHDKVQSMIFPAPAAPAYLHQQCTGRHRWKGYVTLSKVQTANARKVCSECNTIIWDSKSLNWCDDIAWIPALCHVSVCPSQGSVAWLAPDTGSCPRHGLTPHTVLSGLLYFGGRTTATLTVITTTTTAKYVSIGNVKMSNHQKEKSKLRFFYKINVKAQSEAGVLGRCSG